jgi:N-acetylglucosamine-6-sulfatase
VDFLKQARSKPFCLYLAHKAIHPNIVQNNDGSVNSAGAAEDFIPAPRHQTLYAGEKLPRRPNYAVPPKDKPILQNPPAGVPPLSAATATDDATIFNRMRMMKAIDEGLGQMLETLEQSRQLDNTVVILTSDHGYFYGEHCLNFERRLAYEETIRIPLLIRYPKVFAAGSKPQHFALSIDIAPTALDLAGLPPRPMHGQSLRKPAKRDDFLIEYNSDAVFPRVRKMGYHAIRTKEWKYIHYRDTPDCDELYHLKTDPYELRNLIAADEGRRVLPNLKARLAVLLQRS